MQTIIILEPKTFQSFIMVHHKAELQFPDTFNDTATKCFLTDYFESSNNPHAHEESANYFSEDGVFSIGPEKAQGRAGECDEFSIIRVV